jgi:RNA polymerase sigma factor (sigma-70 family)
VLGVCRRLLRHEQDIADAFQATFLVLVHRAGSIRKREALASWLYGVACRTARKVRVRVARQHGREQTLQEVPATETPPDLLWQDLRAVIDEEIDRLSEKYRRPFILCYLKGKTNEEAAQQLG